MKITLPAFLVFVSLAVGCGLATVETRSASESWPPPRLGRELPTLEPAAVLNPRIEAWTSPHWKVVNYWHYFCPPCREELPELERFAESNPEVEVLGVSYLFAPEEMPVGEQLDHFRRIQLAKGVTYPVPLAASYHDLDAFQFVTVPTTLLVDPQGKVVDELRGGRGIREFLEAAERSAQGEPEPAVAPASDPHGGGGSWSIRRRSGQWRG